MTNITIPRLELLSCLLLVELLDVVKRVINFIDISSLYCWSDSEIALYWILGVSKQWNPRVEHRVCKIRKVSNSVVWKHVPGTVNPADVATRDIGAKDLEPNTMWFTGSKFLLFAENHWPKSDNQNKNVKLELKQEKLSTLSAAVNGESYEVIPINAFRDINRLLNVTAYVMRFKNNI